MEDLSFQSRKSNNITQELIVNSADLKIKSICAFVDGRVHARFNDSSALILHKGHECLTYFSKSGNKLRFLVKSIPRTEMVEDKVCLLLKNLNEYNDIPSIHSENLYAGEEQAESSEKITSCIWSLDEECNNNFEVDDQGGISISSMEGHAKLTLLSNKFIIQVEYLQLLPKKKAVLNEDNASILKQDEEQTQIGNSKEFNFKTDFMQKYNLNQQSYKSSSIKDSKRAPSSSSVKLVHQYTRIIKLFTIFAISDRWVLPFFLVWRRLRQQRFITALGREIHPEHEPIFQEDILEFIEIIQQRTQLSSYANELAFKNHIREKYSVSQINEKEVTTELPLVNINSNNSQSQTNSENLWKYDEALPPFDLPKYPERILFAQKENSISWISNQGEVLVFKKDTSAFIFSTLEGKFFHEVKENDTNSIKESEKVFNLLHVWKDDAQTRLLCELAALREHDVLIAQKNQVVNEKSNKIVSEDATDIDIDNYEVVNSCQNEFGQFEAFKNGCVKILFRDRTMLLWMKGQQQIQIISRFGDSISVLINASHEFQEYVEKAVDFRDYCFGDPKEQFEKQRQKQELSQMIDFEISKNQRFLTILSGKVPQTVEEPVGYSPAYSLVESITSECGQGNIEMDLGENNLNFQVEEQQTNTNSYFVVAY